MHGIPQKPCILALKRPKQSAFPVASFFALDIVVTLFSLHFFSVRFAL
jgi:hypothetical protein